ncbi:MAG: TIGR02452 family protein [Clostridia bacterium]|nr:TIGR02452 family protein [Clostridia bacterium]MBQ3707921.1 TIGR02452 family protein [Clostridia bacterium]MBR0443768.1 TIGR02452 family protein [Clostridia bacterium]
MKKNIWLDGIMGVVVGDALGCPVQFLDRETVARNPVRGMRGHGTFNLPAGSWTDDSSMTLALLDSIRENRKFVYEDIMDRFVKWMYEGEYTPFGYSFDIGNGTKQAVSNYRWNGNVRTCGGRSPGNNGNGSLMRIMPACLYCAVRNGKDLTDVDAVKLIHRVSGLTHNHLRAKIACGLYFFMTRALINESGTLIERLQSGLDDGFRYYGIMESNAEDLAYYDRLRDLSVFREVPAEAIRSSGYVVDSIEAAVWSLITTDSFEACELKAVNLGDDTDTVGAIAGGLAGLYYGYGAIPSDWLDKIQRREWIESLCDIETEKHINYKDLNKRVFRDTTAFILDSEALLNSVQETRRNQKLIKDGEPVLGPYPERDKDCAVIVSGKRTLEAAEAYRGKKTCVLNFASSTRPGGGVLWGAGAQEESLCRCSTLYYCLDTDELWRDFYDPHRLDYNPLNNGDMIYSPDVLAVKTDVSEPERLEEKDWYPVNVITCAAPDLRRRYDKVLDPETGLYAADLPEEVLRDVLDVRIRRIFQLAASEGNEVLILGAFGCGAFFNPPALVADIFRKYTEEYRKCFETVEYAVFHVGKESENYRAFQDAFRSMTES